jgi:hypothetical protein
VHQHLFRENTGSNIFIQHVLTNIIMNILEHFFWKKHYIRGGQRRLASAWGVRRVGPAIGELVGGVTATGGRCALLTLLSLTTKMAQTTMATKMLVGAYKRRRRVHTSSNGTRGRLCKTHDHRKVCKRTDYRCSTSPGGIRVVDLYFPKGGTTTKIIE